MVPRDGLEPSRLAAADFESAVSTNSTTRAFVLVGVARFELATPCTPCKCATRLRYTP